MYIRGLIPRNFAELAEAVLIEHNAWHIYLLFGVSAKHLSDEVSTTVSQNDTTGSATLISELYKEISNHNFRRLLLSSAFVLW